MTAIKLGIIGIGRAGLNMHCKEIEGKEEKFQVVAACDVEQYRLDKMTEKYEGCKTYLNLDEFLADPEIEVVSVASRSTEHVEHCKKALEAGKIVFLEKPIAINWEQMLELKEVNEKFPGKLFFRHNRRLEAGFLHIREILAEGLIGEPYEFKLRRNGYQRRDDWQTLIECGGGQLNNWGPHIIDHGLRFLESPVQEIWSDLKKIAAVGDAEDHLKIILKGENGRIVDLEISGGAAITEPVYLILGTKGALSCDDKEITLKYLDPEQKLADIEAKPESPPLDNKFGNAEELKWIEKTLKVEPSTKEDTGNIWDHLYASIREGKDFLIKFEEAMEVVRVTCEVKKGSEFAS